MAQTRSLSARPTTTRSSARSRRRPKRRRPRRSPSAKAALTTTPLPLWKRAAILDKAAPLLTERRDEFADDHRQGGGQADQDRRVEAERAVGTFQFAAAEARKLAGEMIPLDAIAAGEGKLGFTLRVPIGVVGAIAPFNFPLNLVAHKLAPAIAAGCPVVLKPASQTPFSSIALAEMLIDECGLPAEYLHVVTGGGGTVGQRDRRPSRHRPDHLHRVARGRLGDPCPGAAQAGRARAGQQRAGDHRARRRLEDRRGQDQGGRVQPRRPELHLDAADLRPPLASPTTSPRRWSSTSSRWSSAIRSTRPPTSRR